MAKVTSKLQVTVPPDVKKRLLAPHLAGPKTKASLMPLTPSSSVNRELVPQFAQQQQP